MSPNCRGTSFGGSVWGSESRPRFRAASCTGRREGSVPRLHQLQGHDACRFSQSLCQTQGICVLIILLALRLFWTPGALVQGSAWRLRAPSMLICGRVGSLYMARTQPNFVILCGGPCALHSSIVHLPLQACRVDSLPLLLSASKAPLTRCGCVRCTDLKWSLASFVHSHTPPWHTLLKSGFRLL